MESRKHDLQALPYLRTRLAYDPETGLFTWIKHRFKKVLGTTAGCPHSHGYIRIRVHGVSYFAHRLAFMFTHNRLPEGEIDHINRIKTDNRISNLRESTVEENRSNCVAKRKRKGVLKGCYFSKKHNRWLAIAQKDNKRHYIGLFDTEIEAHEAYVEVARKLHGEFFCSGSPSDIRSSQTV